MRGTRTVVIESPYAARDIDVDISPELSVDDNVEYLYQCIRECALRGDSPYASHLMLTRALDDDDEGERALGIGLGLVWRRVADMRIFYVDREWSPGMLEARKLYDAERLPYEVRELGKLLEYHDMDREPHDLMPGAGLGHASAADGTRLAMAMRREQIGQATVQDERLIAAYRAQASSPAGWGHK